MFIVFLRRLCVHVIMKLPDGTVVTADGGVVLMSRYDWLHNFDNFGRFCLNFDFRN